MRSPDWKQASVCERVASHTAVIHKNNLSGSQEYVAQPRIHHALISNAFQLIDKAPMAVRNTEEKDARINTAYDCKQIFPDGTKKASLT